MTRHPAARRPGRRLFRTLLLGGGPLKRTTDRWHALSRLVVLVALLAAVPVGIAVGSAVSTALHATAAAQSASRTQQTATVLADAPTTTAPGDDEVFTTAQWAGPSGLPVTGQVLVAAGTGAGSTVQVWVDRTGRLSTAPLGAGDVAAQSIVSGFLAALALPLLVGLAHLLVVHLLDRVRFRRWTAEWATVEPLWAGRIH